jgi:FlaA1/EpsC-like NDP-sugar epimerase
MNVLIICLMLYLPTIVGGSVGAWTAKDVRDFLLFVIAAIAINYLLLKLSGFWNFTRDPLWPFLKYWMVTAVIVSGATLIVRLLITNAQQSDEGAIVMHNAMMQGSDPTSPMNPNN